MARDSEPKGGKEEMMEIYRKLGAPGSVHNNEPQKEHQLLHRLVGEWTYEGEAFIWSLDIFSSS
jgi:hypothetical protein